MQYQVALSFAGEQRSYVEEVARCLHERSIAVFYDGFEKVSLWGQNGAEAFHQAFEQQAAYVVMFISQAYVDKAWTRHERRSAMSRALGAQREYVLPVRFDDTSVPGLQEDVIFLRAEEHTPSQLAATIAEKLGIERFNGKASEMPPPRMTSPAGEVVFDYSSHNGRYVIGSEVLKFETKWTKASRHEHPCVQRSSVNQRYCTGPRVHVHRTSSKCWVAGTTHLAFGRLVSDRSLCGAT